MPKKSTFHPDASYEEIRTQKLTKESGVRSIVNTSASDGKAALKRQGDPIVIAECIKREQAGDNRVSLLKPLKAKLKKLQPQKALDIKVDEVKAPDIWQPARDYYSMAQRGYKLSVACQVMVGFELISLKKTLGYTQGGIRKSNSANMALFKTFEEHVTAELGIPKRTAYTFISMALGAKSRLTNCYNNLPLLDKPITEYSDDQLKLLDAAVNKITDGETQKSLIDEWKFSKSAQGAAADGGKKVTKKKKKTEPTMQQLSFALFGDPIDSLGLIRTNPDYKKALSALPTERGEEDPVSLISIRSELEAMLADVNATIETNEKAAQEAHDQIRSLTKAS